MNKFGIFKLLNSFFNFNSESDGGKTDLIDGLTKILTNKPEKPKNETVKNANPLPPINRKMLETMSNHTAFVNRVMKNNKKQ